MAEARFACEKEVRVAAVRFRVAAVGIGFGLRERESARGWVSGIEGGFVCWCDS